jgi:acyl dehydratase
MTGRPLNSLTVHDLSVGMTETVPFSVPREDMARFAELSGDFNPLHVDDAFARSKGFKGVVVYGALIVAKVSQLIGMRLPGRDAVWASITLDFLKPLYLNQEAVVEGVVTDVSELTGMVRLKLTVRSSTGQLLTKGKAEVILVRL